MEGLLINQTGRDSSSQRSMKNSPKKLNPKCKKTDSGSRQNRLGRTFSTENVSNLDVGSLRRSASSHFLPSKKPPLLPLPPNLPPKLIPSQASPPLKRKQRGPMTRNSGSSVQKLSGGGGATLGANEGANLLVSSSSPLGPDPSDLPTEVLGIFGSIGVAGEKRSGSVLFLLSPPPSSLPLPKFSVKQKASCRSEAVAVDSGATDSLRRLLRLP